MAATVFAPQLIATPKAPPRVPASTVMSAMEEDIDDPISQFAGLEQIWFDSEVDEAFFSEE